MCFGFDRGGLRIVGYNWGITSIFQPDEGKLVLPAIEMAVSRSLYSENFYYPSQLISKLVALCIYLYSRCSGVELNNSMVQAYFIFRILVAVLGTATIYVGFLIGNYFRKHLGVIVAGLMSVFPPYILLAKQVTGDVSAFFFLSLAVLFSLCYMEEKRNRYLVLIAMGAAMATLEKWHGAVGIGYAGFVVLLNGKKIREILNKELWLIGAYMFWLLLLCPNMVFHIRTAIVDGFIRIAVYNGEQGAPYYSMLLNYMKYGIQHYGGVVYVLVLIAGLVYMINSFTKQYMILLIGIIKTLILCLLNRQFVRWGLELYFCELIIASFGIYWMICLAGKRMQILGYGMALIVTLDFMSGSIVEALVAVYSENDTRLIQERDCLSAGITKNNAVSTYYTGFAPGGMIWVPRNVLSENFCIQDNVLYKKSGNLNSAIINVTFSFEPEMIEAISRECPVLFSYDAQYQDIFLGPVDGMDISWNDLILIYKNMRAVSDISKGALLGYNINVYDTSDVPCLLLED